MTFVQEENGWRATWTLVLNEDERKNKARVLMELVSGETIATVTFSVTVPGITKGFDINVPGPVAVGDRIEIDDGLHNDDCVIAVFLGARPHPIGPEARPDALFPRPFSFS